ncbi:MAG: hypothetical protein ACTSUE_22385 [Promethearchaeota archaeon]
MQKLDFVRDTRGFISMVMYNSNPDGKIFIAPKYFPVPESPRIPGSTWKSHETGRVYRRFEYYWDLREKPFGPGQEKIYSIDTNPDHDYEGDLRHLFPAKLSLDPCHGVAMYTIADVDVVKRYNPALFYKAVMDDIPPALGKYARLLELIENTFSPEQVGITGSYLYKLNQDFSDINIVVYDKESTKPLHRLLDEQDALLDKQDVKVPVPTGEGFHWVSGNLPETICNAKELVIGVKKRFIGSIHDKNIPGARMGFWTSNRKDAFVYGKFTMEQAGSAVISGRLTGWEEGMASGRFGIEDLDLIGFSSEPKSAGLQGDSNPGDAMKITHVQVVGQFHRMFLFDENVIAFGLIQKVNHEAAGLSMQQPTWELLVGGREIGGWILPRELVTPR